MLFVSIKPEKDKAVILDLPKVAVSAGPLGTVAGVQLAALVQWVSTGLRFQVALPAHRVLIVRVISDVADKRRPRFD